MSRQSGVAPSVRALLIGTLALCALAYHPASHAQGTDDAKLDDLMGLVSKYEHPTAASAPLAASVNVQAVGQRVVVAVPGGADAAPSTMSTRRKGQLAGVHVRTALPIVPTSQQMGSGVALPAGLGSRVGAASGGANVALLGQGLVSTALPATQDVADRNRAVTFATHAVVTSSLVDHRAPAAVDADGLVHVGTPAIPLGHAGITIAPVDATVAARTAVLANNGDLADAHAHVGVSVPLLSSTPLVNADVNLHLDGQIVGALAPVVKPITGSVASGNVGSVVTALPATVEGVTGAVTGIVGGVTAATPLGGAVTGVVPPAVGTVNGVVGTVAGAASPSGLGGVLGSGHGLGGVVSGVTSTVGSVVQPAAAGGGLGSVGGVVSSLPATVAGVTNTVAGVVGGVTAATPLGGTVTGVVQPAVATVNGVVGTVAGTASGSGLGGVLGEGNGLGGVVSGVTSTVGSVLKPVATGGPLGAIANLPSTVNGVTGTVTGIIGAATAGTPLAGATSVLTPVTGAVSTVVGSVAGTASGNGLGGVLGADDGTLGKVLPDLGKTVGDLTSTVGAVLAQPNGSGLATALGTNGTASSLLGNVTNTVADTVNSVPGVQLGATGNGQSSGQNLIGAVPGGSNLIDKAVPGVASLLGVAPAAPSAGGTGSGAAGVPVVPAPSATPTGLVVGNGGVVGTAGQLLGSSTNALFSNSNGYVTNGGLKVNAANFTQGYSVVSVAGLPVVNATPVGTLLTTVGGATLGGTGSNSHLTLIGSVSSDSYITNVNNGAAGGLLGLALPNSAPAWASTCANVLGLVKASCWAVNAAQDYQVLMGDGATANGSKEVVIGTNANHTLPAVTAASAFPGNGANDPNDPSGVPTDDYNARLGHSVVIGDSASGTANAQTIIGANATASVANSVALGNASSATRGAQTGYVAYGMPALQNSAGEVSIGAQGQERQITHVAAGSALTDAVNVAQLEAVSFATGNSVQYDDSTHNTVTMNSTTSTDGGVTGGTSIANLHQGDIGATSTQAINGSQLWHWTQDTTNVYSNTSLYNAIQNIKPGGTTINNGGPVKYFNVNSTLADSTATGVNSVAAGPAATASGSSAVAVGNGASATADNAVALGAGSLADRANTVSVGSAGSERQITNVAAGTTATDAVNLGQMQASINTSTQGTVRYDSNTDGSTNYSSVTLGNGNAGTTIHNVADGTLASDAANVGQLNAGIQQAQNWAQNYTDQRFNQLSGQIQNASNRANAGVAAGMAMAGLPQAYEPGRSMAAVSGGTFRGESSIAVGVSTISQGGRWVYKLTGSADTRGDAGFSIGAGMQW